MRLKWLVYRFLPGVSVLAISIVACVCVMNYREGAIPKIALDEEECTWKRLGLSNGLFDR